MLAPMGSKSGYDGKVDGYSQRLTMQRSMLMSGNTPICRIALYALIRQTCGMSGGWVYIMTNRPDGTLYIGVTADLARRAFQHRECMVEGFTKDYRLRMLVWTEWHDDIQVHPFTSPDHAGSGMEIWGRLLRALASRLVMYCHGSMPRRRQVSTTLRVAA
jgi:hypothetical protein